jgi:hypothetical protein
MLYHAELVRIESFETLKSLLVKAIRCENEANFRKLLSETEAQSVIH